MAANTGEGMRKLVAWDTGAGATIVNDDRMLWNFVPVQIRINGIGPTPIFTDGAGMTVFGRAFLIKGAPMSLVSQTAMEDQNIEFESRQSPGEYTIPVQDGIPTEINFTRERERRLYTTDADKIINITRRVDKSKTSDMLDVRTFIAVLEAMPSMADRAEAARLHVATGHENDKYLIQCLEKGIITHTSTSLDKLKAAIRYNSRQCKCFACQIGKSVKNNQHAPHVRETVPGKSICADQVFSLVDMDNIIHLISVDEATAIIDCHEIERNTGPQITGAIQKLKMQWNVRGYDNITIKFDACTVVESIRKYATPVNIEQAQPGQHQVLIEATIGSIRDRMRAIIASLNFAPDYTMSKYLVVWVITTMNCSYNRIIDDVPYHKLNPAWSLRADVDLTVGYGDLILAQIQKKGGSAGKFVYAKHPCIVLGALMNGTGTIVVYSLFTKAIYFSSGLPNAYKHLPWSIDMEKVVTHVIWSTHKQGITDEEDFFQRIPPESALLPDFFNTLPETIIKANVVKALKKMEMESEKPLASFDQVYDMWRNTALPDVIEAIDQQQLLTKIAYEKRMAKAKAPDAMEISDNDSDIITTPKEYIPHNTGDNRPPTIATDDSTQLKPPPHIDNDDGLRRIATDDSTQLQELNAGVDDETRTTATGNSTQSQPKTHITKQVTRKRGATKIAPMETIVEKPPTYKGPRTSRNSSKPIEQAVDPPPLKKGPRPSRSNSQVLFADMQASTAFPATLPDASTDHELNTEAAAETTSTHVDQQSIRDFIQDAFETEQQFRSLMVMLTHVEENDNAEKKRLTLESKMKELTTLFEKKTIHPLHHDAIWPVEMQKRLLTKLFTVIKRDNKYKSRAVAGGGARPQQREEGMVSCSPTAKWESVFMGLRVAIEQQRDVSTMDFTAAFLNAPLPPQKSNGVDFRRILELTPDIVQLVLELHPEWEHFVCPGRGKNGTASKGSMFFVIDKALYGMIESSLAWFNELSGALIEMGFIQSESDPCVFHSYLNGDRTSIIVYVDDLMIFAKTRLRTLAIRQQLLDKYHKLETWDFETTDELSYLNIQIKRVADKDNLTTAFTLNQSNYCKKMIDELGLTDIPNPFESTKLPYTTDLFKVDPTSPPLSKADATFYTSAVGKLLYTATKIRIALALPASFLCKRMHHPTTEDMDKLLRVLHWIKEKPNGGICIHAGDPDDMKLYVWADASDNCHFDAKGHTGVYISIGKDNGSPVFFMSKVQSLVSRSSTEAELIAVYQSIPHALWAMHALSEWGYVQEQLTLYQDNISTIISSLDGSKPYSKTGHINRRIFNSREYILSGTIVMPHCSTHDMLADPLTKPLSPGIAEPHLYNMCGLGTQSHDTVLSTMQETYDDSDAENEIYGMAVLDESYDINIEDIVSQIQVNLLLNLHLYE